MPIVTERLEARQYDGTNGTELLEWLNGCELVSDQDGVLVAEDESAGQFIVDTGSWIVAWSPSPDYQNRYRMVIPNAAYQLRYVELPPEPAA
jgi:hypothetical protein